MKPEVKRKKRIRRHARTRAKVFGTKKRPRLSIFRSNNHIHLQLVDDTAGKTIVSVSTQELDTKLSKTDAAKEAGKKLATAAAKAGIKEAIFDRGGYRYHGRVQSACDAVREAGIKI